jgi:hypothetical protein
MVSEFERWCALMLARSMTRLSPLLGELDEPLSPILSACASDMHTSTTVCPVQLTNASASMSARALSQLAEMRSLSAICFFFNNPFYVG